MLLVFFWYSFGHAGIIQIVARNSLNGPKNLMAVLEAEVEAVEEAGEAMKSLTGDELAAFATPASTLEKVISYDVRKKF